MNTKVLLLLAAVTCVALAQTGRSGPRCVCRRVRDKFGPARAILDIQIYPPSASCDNMEIVVSLKNGVQYCLDPRMKKVQDLVSNLLSMKSAEPTALPEAETTDVWSPV
ncbi:interleukin-8-like [Megalops cyprinoides]|uniref:interleukin-8-like n=1 Tax=Megalops cyprinoides TaxID=118141 RepID=UPI001864BF55|nr:interleukin-8-like [Megalops cyprinoides]